MESGGITEYRARRLGTSLRGTAAAIAPPATIFRNWCPLMRFPRPFPCFCLRWFAIRVMSANRFVACYSTILHEVTVIHLTPCRFFTIPLISTFLPLASLATFLPFSSFSTL